LILVSCDEKNQLTLEGYMAYIKQQIEGWEVDKFVIVAHSIGGLLGLKLADLFHDRLVGFVAVGAAIPKNEGSFYPFFHLQNVYSWYKTTRISHSTRTMQ
jgi:pimeloyl-ACP methyl ester carboxylesterase